MITTTTILNSTGFNKYSNNDLYIYGIAFLKDTHKYPVWGCSCPKHKHIIIQKVKGELVLYIDGKRHKTYSIVSFNIKMFKSLLEKILRHYEYRY